MFHAFLLQFGGKQDYKNAMLWTLESRDLRMNFEIFTFFFDLPKT